MIMSDRLKELLKNNTTLTATLPDGREIPVAALPMKIQQAIATLDEWVLQQKIQELEVSKTGRAIASLQRDIVNSIAAHIAEHTSAATTEAPARKKSKRS